jgi:acyl-coenzyme A synthetase/AMP-(fatty) acid ligase
MFDRHIRAQAIERPNAPAVLMPRGPLSFAMLDAAVNSAAFELRDIDPPRGEPVRVDIAYEPLQWVISLGLARRGIASSPASDEGCSLTVSDTGSRGASYVLSPGTIQRIMAGDAAGEVPEAAPPPQALARVIRTSGTTGEVKRIGLSWAVVEARTRHALADYGPFDGPCLVDPRIDTALGLIVTLAAWASGQPVLWDCSLDDPLDVARFRPRILSAVPFRLQQFIDALPPDYPKWPLRIVSAGGPIPKPLNGAIEERLTSKVANIYGSSEAGAVAIADLDAMARVERAAGYVLPNVEVEVVAPDGAVLPHGELGEIRVRGEKVAGGYLPSADTGSAFRGGWYYTSDLGRLEPDGLLIVEGRADDVMNLGGIKVLPAWIEEAVLQCPGVEDAAAFALSDTTSVNSCHVAFVASAGADPQGLQRALSEQTKHLCHLNLVRIASIPRNAMGKVDRKALRELVSSSLADGRPSSA